MARPDRVLLTRALNATEYVVWDGTTGQLTRICSEDACPLRDEPPGNGVDIAADGPYLVKPGEELLAWDYAARRLIGRNFVPIESDPETGGACAFRDVGVLPGAKLVLALCGSIGHSMLVSWDLQSNTVKKEFDRSGWSFRRFVLSPDGTHAAFFGLQVGVQQFGRKGHILVWDLSRRTGEWSPEDTCSCHDGVFSSDGKYFVTASKCSGVQYFDLRTHKRTLPAY